MTEIELLKELEKIKEKDRDYYNEQYWEAEHMLVEIRNAIHKLEQQNS